MTSEQIYEQVTTSLYAAGLFNEAFRVEEFYKELLELKAKVKSGKPICPICQAVLEPFNYAGYYDSFSAYACNCDKFDKVEVSRGQYA